jgi:pimeloyl-ACP methyl ester carboxylesterase
MTCNQVFGSGLAAGLLLLVACGGDDDDAPGRDEREQSEPKYEVEFTEGECDVALPEGQSDDTVRCGVLTLPEDRQDRESENVEIAVAVLLANSDEPQPDPVVYLHDGPGGAALDLEMQRFSEGIAGPLQRDRDIVFFDQRGGGRSEPSLQCPEYLDALTLSLSQALDAIADIANTNRALLACRERLEGEGINLAVYNSTEVAADMRDLMTSLGYEEWNIYGVGYGSRVALTALRDNPGPIRSVILDSPEPIEANDLELASRYDKVVGDLLAACRADPVCDGSNPRLRETLDGLEAAWTTNPPGVQALPTGAEGDSYPVFVTTTRLIGILQHVIQRTESLSQVPGALDAWARGQFGTLSSFATTALSDEFILSHGANRAFHCNEEAPFVTAEDITSAQEGLPPEVALAFGRDPGFCEEWGSLGANTEDNQGVRSGVPVLVLVGTLDPLVGDGDVRVLERRLANSYVVEFSSTSHAVLFSQPACAVLIVADFLDDPEEEPSDDCAQEIPPLGFVEF